MPILPAWMLSLKTAPGKWKIRCLENLELVLKLIVVQQYQLVTEHGQQWKVKAPLNRSPREVEKGPVSQAVCLRKGFL